MGKKIVIIIFAIAAITLITAIILAPDYMLINDMVLSSGLGREEIREVEIRATTFKFWKGEKIAKSLIEENIKINNNPMATSIKVRLYYTSKSKTPFLTVKYDIPK